MTGRWLEGATVLELAGGPAAGYCGRLLAALGAQVTRLEGGGAPAGGWEEAYLPQGKRRVAVDLSDAKGRAVLGEHVGASALVVADDHGGLSREELAGMVDGGASVVLVTPFGLTGPAAAHVGGDLVASHAGGYAYHVTWSVDDPATEPPQRGPAGQAQLVTGLTAALAAVACLRGAARGRPAALIDVSEQECVATLLFPELSELNEGTLKPDRRRARGGSKVAGGLVGLLRCADGYVVVSPREEHQWQRLVELLGAPDWVADARFADVDRRMANWEPLQELIQRWTGTRRKEEVFRAAQERRIACYPVNSIAEVLDLEQLRHRGFWLADEATGARIPGLPFTRGGRDA